MAVSDHTSHDKPARPTPAAEPDPPRRQERPDGRADTEKPVTSDSGKHAAAVLEQGQEQPQDSTLENRPLSRHASDSFARTIAVVPRAERRGLLGRFALIPEIEKPHEYRNSTKWMVTAIVALAAAGAPMGSGIFLPALPSLTRDLGVTETVANMTIAFYMLAMSIFPLWWSSFSETLGRRTIYIVSFALFVIFSILSAVSVSISMLVVMRVLGGGASASVQAVGAGTIADIWEPAHRGRAMGIFYLGPLMGPLLSPIIGGALVEAFGWRATMWFLAIYGGVMLLMLLFCLPETLAKPPPPAPLTDAATTTAPLQRTSTTRSVALHTRRTAALLKRFFIDPLSVLLYLRHPPVLLTVYLASIAFGALYVLNISIQSTFSTPPYSFAPIPLGLLYLAPSLGYILASTAGGRWLDRIMTREARRAGRYDAATGRLILLPEDRMRENMWLAATLYPAALVWYGWAAARGVHFMVPCAANFFFGCGSMLVFGAVTTMLTEFMPRKSSSGVAVNNFVRNIFSCVGSVVAQPLIDAMGNGWLFTMVGLFAWVTGYLAIWALKRNGAAWRVSMDRTLNKERGI
ncbi:MFS general substrate transporter [Trichocladium antarcticum]|uniref:MFS general substrate transporter n=1 Tax=Trichocladium antarcticum TaxID=1450529 RepID=A0AAN6ZAI3_9PEZI|nr:MFS general substrate transporter [Trichocladium antarcticum]